MSLLKLFVKNKGYFLYILLILSVILNIYFFNSEKVVYKDKIVYQDRIVEVPVKVNAETVSNNKVSVKQKQNVDNADIVLDTKQDLKVSLNGKVVDLKPINKEEFTFGKDYAELNYSTNFKLDLENKPLEPSWGIGVGYNTDKKLQGIFIGRIKKTPLHVWGTTDGHSGAVGIMFSTNYK